MTAGRSLTLGNVADLVREASAQERVSVHDIVVAVGKRGLHPLLLVPALLAATPLSGIPGVSAICGLLIALISIQLLMSSDKVRLPAVLMRRSVDGAVMRKALDTSRPVIDWFDRHTRRRLSFLFHRPLIYLPELLCLLSGLMMPMLEFIPFSASIVATGVAFLALSMMTRDGLFFIFALVPYAGLAALLVGPLA
jgi:hypothetical protein